ncbi:MAG: hypothetical protein IT454_09385 [Planctomycetes bacterium]|nr:hypothetical protein [Planctomycetota bacterium]
MSTKPVAPCPNCGGSNLYRSQLLRAGGGYAPNYLPDLGSFWAVARFKLVVCRDCGLTRWFAQPPALEKLDTSDHWEPVN